MNVDVSILGAGIAGLCVATELARQGVKLRIIDPAGSPGAHCCSWWAGGMLAPYCEGFTAEPDVVRLGAQSAGWWEDHTPVAHEGTLVVALGRDRSELRNFAGRVPEAQTCEPSDRETDLSNLAEGLFVADEAHVTPRLALIDLVKGLAAKGIRIEKSGEVAGQLIDCRGFAAKDVLPDLRGVRGEMAVIRCSDIVLKRPVRLLHPRFPLYIVPRGDGVFMIGATQIENASRGPITLRSTVELLNAAYALHPAFAEAEVLEMGADVRPAFSDNMPRIRHLHDRICVNGLFRHGFLLAPALARMVAAYLQTETKPEVWYEDHR